MDLFKRFLMRRHMFSFLTLAFLLNVCNPAHSVAVMSVDFGSEWMKVAIVSPGVPMEIALNKESKRKTPIAIAFRDGERTFGEDAMTVCVRFPKNCYLYLLDLLGKQVDNPVVKLYQQRFPHYNIVPDPERGTVVFQHDDETQFSVEELVAMMISKAREMAVLSANQPINEVVITAPGFFNQAERKALIQAAELAGLKVLQLINDYTAVALNYGIFRRKDFNETAQYIMLYDMGASSTSASIISYQVVKTKDKGFLESNPQLAVIGVGYDRTLGGLEMQLRLRDYLANKFNEMKKTKNDVTQNPRSMAKLFKEAGRLKNVLSANADHYAQVEGLIDEVDFKLQVTREDFEKLCTDLFERVGNPVQQALKTAGLSLDVLSQVILVGAGTRVPAVQEKLSSIVGIDLSKNLNTDEAAVFGAVYKAADLSAGFKVKKFITKDSVLFPIQVTFEREVDGNTRQMKRTLFGLMNSYPQKKILTFNKNLTDFDFNVGYGDVDYLPPQEVSALGSLNISKVSLTGVGEVLGKHQGPGVESKGIKAHFQMDDSGILNLVNVEHVVEKTIAGEEEPEESPLSKLGSTISKLFTGPEDTLKETLDKPEDKEEGKEGDKKDEKGSEGNKTRDGTDKDDSKPKDNKPKILTIKEPIQSKEETLAVQSMSEKHLDQAQAKIDRYNLNDEQKRRHEKALNALESFVFEARAKLDLKEYQSAATQEEADAILKSCSELSDWLDENGFEADADTLENKLKELKKLTYKVWDRVKEHQERPDALAALNSVVNGSLTFLNTIKNATKRAESEMADIFTEVEISSLEKVIKETEDWVEKSVAEQNEQPLNQSPKLSIKLIMEKMANLDREVKYLVNKMKFWKPKVPPSTPEDKPKDETVNTNQTNKTDIPVEQELPDLADMPTIETPAPDSNTSSSTPEDRGDASRASEDSANEPLPHTEL